MQSKSEVCNLKSEIIQLYSVRGFLPVKMAMMQFRFRQLVGCPHQQERWRHNQELVNRHDDDRHYYYRDVGDFRYYQIAVFLGAVANQDSPS